MTYIPNFSDPRVKKRILRAFNYCTTRFDYTKPKFSQRDVIDKEVGYNHKPLGRYLRNLLLEEHDSGSDLPYVYTLEATAEDKKKKNRAKKWLLREAGVSYIAQKFNLPYTTAAQIKEYKINAIVEEFKEPMATGNWQYEEKSHRLWNNAQQIPNEIRRPAFARAGYVYDYDIIACAPNLIKQYAQRNGLTKSTPYLDEYLNDRDFHRDRLANLLNIDKKTVKEIINARFAGARLGVKKSIGEFLGNNRLQIEKLKNDKWFQGISRDIKKCWDVIKTISGRRRIDSKYKWDIYFVLESQVMRSINSIIKKETTRHFKEHDGFRCDSWINPHALELEVQKKTGYTVKFKFEHLTA